MPATTSSQMAITRRRLPDSLSNVRCTVCPLLPRSPSAVGLVDQYHSAAREIQALSSSSLVLANVARLRSPPSRCQFADRERERHRMPAEIPHPVPIAGAGPGDPELLTAQAISLRTPSESSSAWSIATTTSPQGETDALRIDLARSRRRVGCRNSSENSDR
jgi:hypothetical protein